MKRYALAAALAISTGPGFANEFEPVLQDFYETQIATWADSAVLIEAISARNLETAAYDQAEIDALDAAWQAEVGAGQTPTITPVLENAAADFLRQQVEASGGQITEIFIMDAQGLNVAASDVTSDFWQGDEDKFTRTHGAGAGAVFIDEIEFDESSQRYQGQISLTISDPTTGEPIGAMTVGVDAESLM